MNDFLYGSLVLNAMNALLAFEKYQNDPELLKLKAFSIADSLIKEFRQRESLMEEMSKKAD